MKRHTHRRKKLAKLADTYGFLIFKILLVIAAVAFAGLLTYVISTFRG